MSLPTRSEPTGRSADQRTPIGFSIAAGTACVVAGAFIDSVAFPAGDAARLAVLALVVAVFALVVDDARAAIAVAAVGYLVFTGFLVNQYGHLAWGGRRTMWYLVAFALAAGVGLGLRWSRRRGAFVGPADHEHLEKGSHGG